jgi:hypothetical protein
MWRMPARRLVAIFLSVILATAVAIRPGHVNSSTDVKVATTMDMGAMGMPMHGKCDGCAGHEKSTALTACSAYCGATAALPYLTVAYNPMTTATLRPRVALPATGINAPPDPYPPRPISMS